MCNNMIKQNVMANTIVYRPGLLWNGLKKE